MIFSERSVNYLKTKKRRSKKCHEKQMADFFYNACYKKVVLKLRRQNLYSRFANERSAIWEL